MTTPARILIVAGSDSGGGAGIQADLKTVTALGGYGMTAITALTAQNTLGVHGIHPVPAEFVARQMRVVLEDIGADAIKTGMLLNAEIIEAVADVLADYPETPLILDPVMVAKGGAPLLEPDAIEALKTRLLPRATLLTPNIPEAELLTGMKIENVKEMREAAECLSVMMRSDAAQASAGQPTARSRALESPGMHSDAAQASATLLKGGHLAGDPATDLLFTANGMELFENPRITTQHTHGTGCTLASAIATGLGQGMPLAAAVHRGIGYVQQAIRTAPGLGQGHGPLGLGVPAKTA